MKKIRVFQMDLDDKTAAVLAALGAVVGCKTADDAIEYVLHSILDGVRRPASWERELLYPLFGEEGVACAQRVLLQDSEQEEKK
jgi:hypothetical protein